jgi:hypothetical protein
MREWTDSTAQKLTWASGALAAFCLAVAAERTLERLEVWRMPGAGHPAAGIAVWAVLAVSLLLGMDRGIPREGAWGRRLLWARRALLLSAFAALAAIVLLR